MRGKVLGFLLGDENTSEEEKNKTIDTAKKYFALAEEYAKNIDYRYIEFRKPVVIMTSGFSATGKSYIARKFKKFININFLSTDVIRKELFKIPHDKKLHQNFGEGIYSPKNVKKIYDEMFARSIKLVSEGKNCFLDAVFIKRDLRKQGMNAALEANAEFVILNTFADDENIKYWIKKKVASTNDPSDATWEIYLKQKKNWEDFTNEENKFVLKIDGNSKFCYEEAFDKLVELMKENIK